MRALRVELTATLAYWTVVDDEWQPVPVADTYLRHLRLGADRAEGTTRVYAGDLALFLAWCHSGGRDLPEAARSLSLFVAMLRTAPVERAGAGRGRARSPGRINQILAAVRELYKHAVANDGLDACVLAFLYEVGDDRYLPADLRPEGSGLRYVAKPRHMQRARRRATPDSVGADEIEALLQAASSWRDRFLLVLLWFCGLRIGEALGLRRSDLHFVTASAALGCSVPGPHLHVVGRDNPNRARAKSGDRHVPVRAEVLSCYDRYLGERAACPPAGACDFGSPYLTGMLLEALLWPDWSVRHGQLRRPGYLPWPQAGLPTAGLPGGAGGGHPDAAGLVLRIGESACCPGDHFRGPVVRFRLGV